MVDFRKVFLGFPLLAPTPHAASAQDKRAVAARNAAPLKINMNLLDACSLPVGCDTHNSARCFRNGSALESAGAECRMGVGLALKGSAAPSSENLTNPRGTAGFLLGEYLRVKRRLL